MTLRAVFCVHIIATLLLLFGVAPASADGPDALLLKDQERILFLGSGFVENDLWHAYLETRLQRRFPNRNLNFRYMGWSGDTVRATARTAGFQVPQGLARLEKETQAQKPTLIFLAYGMNESFDGPKGLADFRRDYDKLLTALGPLRARVVIVSPTYHEDLGRPFPDPGEHNKHLLEYALTLKELAQKRKLCFVDLFHALEAAKKANPRIELTTNGILLTKAGYIVAAKAIEEQLGFTPYRWNVIVEGTSEGTKIGTLTTKRRAVRFEATDTMLPVAGDDCRLTITDLPDGNYTLKIDGDTILTATSSAWGKGVNLEAFAGSEKLRAEIVQRNQLFYRRWRPYNDHSRHWGFIGGDFKLYDQDIAAQEKRIAAARTPQPRTFEIAPKAP
ncbi:MAG TPA: SGNH/GDSL hydrolase family protein [Gemmataceae bacterium]|nr:SGNH/GDSL hydrolase family protein [Gemmataceae bacterium]